MLIPAKQRIMGSISVSGILILILCMGLWERYDVMTVVIIVILYEDVSRILKSGDYFPVYLFEDVEDFGVSGSV